LLGGPGYAYADTTTYGILYNRYAVNTRLLAPAGWHVPSNDEWDTLLSFLTRSGYNWDSTTQRNKLAKALCSKVDWDNFENGPAGSPRVIPNENNKTGFTALSGGYRLPSGSYEFQGDMATWWSRSNIKGTSRWSGIEIYWKIDSVMHMDYYPVSGCSVRLIKDTAAGELLTDIDGNVYRTVRLGNQVWTTENLRTTRFNDGTVIPKVADSTKWQALSTPGYCTYGNTTKNDSIAKFGMLYNWYVVNTNKIAPKGWHVPSKSEMDTLIRYLINNEYSCGYPAYETDYIGKSMAAATDWDSSSTQSYEIRYQRDMNNTSGWSMLPGGRRVKGFFVGIGNSAYWWVDMEYDTENGYNYFVYSFSAQVNDARVEKTTGNSIRLVKD
jgi:uncharacterized protein (TIGR02145 family)